MIAGPAVRAFSRRCERERMVLSTRTGSRVVVLAVVPVDQLASSSPPAHGPGRPRKPRRAVVAQVLHGLEAGLRIGIVVARAPGPRTRRRTRDEQRARSNSADARRRHLGARSDAAASNRCSGVDPTCGRRPRPIDCLRYRRRLCRVDGRMLPPWLLWPVDHARRGRTSCGGPGSSPPRDGALSTRTRCGLLPRT